jgi:hypothetical protein
MDSKQVAFDMHTTHNTHTENTNDRKPKSQISTPYYIKLIITTDSQTICHINVSK